MILNQFFAQKIQPRQLKAKVERYVVDCGKSGLIAASEKAEQVQEQVDEVEIKPQRSHGGHFADHRGVGLGAHCLDVLGIPCSKSHKNQDSSNTDAPIHHRATQKQVHQRADDKSDKRHE